MSFADCIQKSSNCNDVIPVISIQHKTVNSFTFIIKDATGTPVDLTPYTAPPAPGTYTGAQLVIRDNYTNTSAAYAEEIPILVAIDGSVTLSFDADDFQQPGMYIAVIDLLINNNVKQFFTYYFMVNPGLDYTSVGPITIPEIRIALRDVCPEANVLIDDLEYSDAEIAYCIRRPIDYWNGCLPPIPMVSPINFPYRYEWMNATIAELLLIAGRQFMRNELPYAAAGLTVQDGDKNQRYLQLGTQMLETWKIYVQQKKVSINMGRAFSTMGSGIRSATWWRGW